MAAYEKRKLSEKFFLSQSDKSEQPVRQTQVLELLFVFKRYPCKLLDPGNPVFYGIPVHIHRFCRIQDAAFVIQEYRKAFPQQRMVRTVIFFQDRKSRMPELRGGKHLRYLFFNIRERERFALVDSRPVRSLSHRKDRLLIA